MVAIAATSSIYRPVLAPNLMWGSLISLVLPGVGALGRGRPGGIQPDVVPTSLLGEPRHQDGMNSKRVQAIMNKFFHSTPLNVWSLGNDTLTWRSFGYIFRVLTISASKILDITDRKENFAVHNTYSLNLTSGQDILMIDWIFQSKFGSPLLVPVEHKQLLRQVGVLVIVEKRFNYVSKK